MSLTATSSCEPRAGSAASSTGTAGSSVAAFLIGALLIVALGPGAWQSLRPQPGTFLDFFKEWSAARNRLAGHPVYQHQRLAVRRYLGGDVDLSQGFFDAWNTHPPLSAALALPLATLSYPDAQFVWNLATLAAVACSLVIVCRELDIPLPLSRSIGLLGLALLCDPLRQTLLQGQPNGFLLLLLTGSWAAERRGLNTAAGVLAAAAALVKLYPGWLLVYFLFRRNWPAVTGFVAGGGLLFLLSAGLMGFDAHRDYFLTVLPGVPREINHWGNVSWVAFWERLLGESNATIESWQNWPALRRLAVLVSLLLTAGVAAWAAARATSAGPADPLPGSARLTRSDLAFSIQVLAMLLLTPMTWHHSFVILLPAMGILLAALPQTGARRATLLILLALLWLAPRLVWRRAIPPEPPLATQPQSTSGPANLAGRRISRPWQSLTALSYQTYALAGLMTLATVRLHQRKDPTPPLARAGSDSADALGAEDPAGTAPVAAPASGGP